MSKSFSHFAQGPSLPFLSMGIAMLSARARMACSAFGRCTGGNASKSCEATRERLGAPTDDRGSINNVAIHPSGKLAISVGKDKTVRVWNLMKVGLVS